MSNKFVPNGSGFRWYEDGTESGSAPIANEDTNVTGRSVDADSQVHLRCQIEEVGDGDVAGASSDDWSCAYRLNGGGSWIDITGSSARVKADTGSSLTDGNDTTNRGTNGITDPSGSFFAGVQESSDGEITNFQHEANNFTEHVFAFILVSADLNDADSLAFRMELNGTNISQDANPNITVSKSADTNIAANTDTLVISEKQAIVNAETNITTTADTLVIAEKSATIIFDVNVNTTAHALTLAGQSAIVNAEISITTTVHALTLSGIQATVSLGKIITTNVHALTLSEKSATINAATNLTTTVDALTLAGIQSNVNAANNITTTVDALTLAGVQANVNAATNVTASVHALTLAGVSATVTFTPVAEEEDEDEGSWWSIRNFARMRKKIKERQLIKEEEEIIMSVIGQFLVGQL